MYNVKFCVILFLEESGSLPQKGNQRCSFCGTSFAYNLQNASTEVTRVSELILNLKRASQENVMIQNMRIEGIDETEDRKEM